MDTKYRYDFRELLKIIELGSFSDFSQQPGRRPEPDAQRIAEIIISDADPHNAGLPSLMDIIHHPKMPREDRAIIIAYVIETYPSHYLYQLMGIAQQRKLSDKVPGVFRFEDGDVVINVMKLADLLARFDGFRPTKNHHEKNFYVPVADFLLPPKFVSDISIGKTTEKGASFEVKVTGFSGGFGKKELLSIENNPTGLKGGFQLQVEVKVRYREFRNRWYKRIIVCDILSISSLPQAISNKDNRYVKLDVERHAVDLMPIGSRGAANQDQFSIAVGRGYSSRFEVPIRLPKSTNGMISVFSKSKQDMSVKMKFKSNKEYRLYSAKNKSLIYTIV